MTKLPDDIARELEELFGDDDGIPDDAVTIRQLSEEKGGSTTQWSLRMRKLVTRGTWQRGRKVNSQAYWYWPVEDEKR